MATPWFDLDPNNLNDKWWLYTTVVDCEKNEYNDYTEEDAICYLIIQDSTSMGHVFYRVSTWYKDDPNRYQSVVYDLDWLHCQCLENMRGNDIVKTINNYTFKVSECRFSNFSQLAFCKILERIDFE